MVRGTALSSQLLRTGNGAEGSRRGPPVWFGGTGLVCKGKCVQAAQPSGATGHMEGVGSMWELLAWPCAMTHRRSSYSGVCLAASQEEDLGGWERSHL